MNCVFFWRTCTDRVFHKGCLSQWFKSKFVIDDVTYNCAEQYMMAEKARVFGDNATLGKILEAKAPHVIKRLGREVVGFDGARWNEVKFDIVVRGNRAKFAQNVQLRDFLLGSGDATLVEASPKDAIWGVGLDETDRRILDPDQWQGENLLGKALMKVRAELVGTREAQEVCASPTDAFRCGAKSVVDIDALRVYYVRQEMGGGGGVKKARSVKQDKALGVGVTHQSLVLGLRDVNSRKWLLFLKDGPYWNYLVAFLTKKRIFPRKPHLIEDAVERAIRRVAEYFGAGRFEHNGNIGSFRKFLKVTTVRAAFDILNGERKQTRVASEEVVEKSAQEAMTLANRKINAQGPDVKESDEDSDMWSGFDGDDDAQTKSLDEYDKATGMGQSDGGGDRGRRLERHLVSFEDLQQPGEDDAPSGEDAAAMYAWRTKIGTLEMKTLQEMQRQVIFLALGFLLPDEKIKPWRRQVLRLLYIDGWKPGKIWKLPEFARLEEQAFYKRVYDAKDVLRKRALDLWRLVAPEGETASDRQLLMLWTELAQDPKRWRMAKALRKKADAPA